VFALDHLRQQLAAHQHWRQQVGIYIVMPVLPAELQKGRVVLVLAEIGAVVDHDIDVPAALKRVAAHPAHVLFHGQVAFQLHRPHPGGFTFGGSFLKAARMVAGPRFDGAGAEDDVGARTRQRHCDSAADAAAGSGDQCCLSFEIHLPLQSVYVPGIARIAKNAVRGLSTSGFDLRFQWGVER
jgi:hypothetical protein